MLSIVGMIFLFRFGSIAPHDTSLPVSFRAEAHQLAIESAARWSPSVDPTAGPAPASGSLDLPLLFGAGPVVGPLRPAYHPRDWVSAVAHRLNVADHPLARAAIWLSGVPLELDARPPSRVYVRLTLTGF